LPPKLPEKQLGGKPPERILREVLQKWLFRPTRSLARSFYAIEQPADVEVGEVVIRPTMQDF